MPRHSVFCLFFFSCYGDHRDLHSFPTRRSSDLTVGSQLSGLVVKVLVDVNDRVAAGQALAEIDPRSEEHTSELQSRRDLVCRLLLEKKKNKINKCWTICCRSLNLDAVIAVSP